MVCFFKSCVECTFNYLFKSYCFLFSRRKNKISAVTNYVFLFYDACTYRCFGCQVLEGYGMTETSCIISCMDIGDNLSGHVGSPNPACGELSAYVLRIKNKKIKKETKYCAYIVLEK